MKRQKPYRIIGAYDSETTNINDYKNGGIYAFPILHQLGLIDTEIQNITSDTVEQHTNIKLYRHSVDLYEQLEAIAESQYDYVPVICCHNLSFDMYGLSAYLDSCNVRVLAKSCRKPITFAILDDDNQPCLVLWDTLVFSQQSLARMGVDCGYAKAVGEWNYDLIRTPATPLSKEEIEYACKDVYALIAWLAWWLKRNPDIQPEKLALNVVTKTGVVREKRKVRFSRLKGKYLKYSCGEYWYYLNKSQAPKTDDELYIMFAATRGGFTFCANEHASEVYDLIDSGFHVYGFDATSMHPSCMVSHYYPVGFHKTSQLALQNVLHITERTTLTHLLNHWAKPFNSAIYACYEFENLKPKQGTLYAKHGILPLASARFGEHNWELNEDSQDAQAFREQNERKDTAINPVFLYGKLVSADLVRVYVTELGLWEITQAYEYTSAKAVEGYITGRFVRPSDMSVISVMQFYKAKALFKQAKNEYKQTQTLKDDLAQACIKAGIPESMIKEMQAGFATDSDVSAQMQSVKADLNSLYGIECSNEYRRDTVLTSYGIDYQGDFGICNAPKNPKAWYQYGQRIVGWSRIAQHVFMQLTKPIALDIINGDTDSVKLLIPDTCIDDFQACIKPLHDAIDKAKAHICKRVKRNYPAMYDKLDGIGHYVVEFASDRFCTSWNKAYCMHDLENDGKRHFAFTIAGIPTKRGLNQIADRLYEQGYTFADICNKLLGYNVTVSYDLLKLHARKFPEWGEILYNKVTDYQGKTCTVAECAALALYPMAKTINDTGNKENHDNAIKALENNPDVNIDDLIITDRGLTWL